MRLTSWTRRISQILSSGHPRARRSRRAVVSAELLEARTLLTTMFYLDFGIALPAGGLSTTVEDFRNIDGSGTNGFGTGSNVSGRAGLVNTDQLDFNSIQFDYNGDLVIDAADALALQNDVLPIVQRELAAFDIEAIGVGASSFLDVVTTLNSNDELGDPGFDGFGENDVYNFIMEISSPDITTDGGLLGTAGSLFGIAAGEDLFTGTGNNHDEATLTFTDTIVSSTSGVPGTDEFNENLAHRIAYTTVHEAMHTFGLFHTRGLSAEERLLSSGDTIRSGSVTRETDNIVTRFDLQLNGSGTLVNNYEILSTDADIGLRDSDRDGVPDFAYVTGTGAHDLITLTDLGGGVTQVQIDAYFDSAMTDLIRSDSYTITQGVDTEGGIVIDSSVGDDLIQIDAAVTTDVLVHAGQGDDVVESGSGNDRLFGEDGNDVISGGVGNDVIFGGAGNDVLNGNNGSDLVFGDDGDDIIRGNAGNDFLLGGNGLDVMFGGAGNDFMAGQDGNDRMYGELGNDRMYGGNGSDIMAGNDGDDRMHGNLGNDVVLGGNGRDVLFGGAGNDVMVGGDGGDQVNGGLGDDIMFGGNGSDIMSGNDGNDRMYGGQGNDMMSGGNGSDIMSGNDGNDRMLGDRGNDRMLGGNGRDVMLGGAGNDFMVGHDGNDFMAGQDGNDVMLGGNGSDFMLGGNGNDVMLGGNDFDFMFGQDGDDIMIGGVGADLVFGGPGVDLIFA